MVAASDTFVNAMIDRLGMTNVFQDQKRYPEVKEDNILEAKPDWILLSSEPYPFGEEHVAVFKQLFQASKIILVDGEMFSWYGSRLRYVAEYIKSKLVPLI